MNKKLSSNQRALVRRYLVWCYKTTKESLDRIDRYFTQLIVDEFILKELRRAKEFQSSRGNNDYKKMVDGFLTYVNNKEKNVLKKKFKNIKSKELRPEYLYLQNRLKAVEKAVCEFLSRSELLRIRALYEEEMTSRILQAREYT